MHCNTSLRLDAIYAVLHGRNCRHGVKIVVVVRVDKCLVILSNHQAASSAGHRGVPSIYRLCNCQDLNKTLCQVNVGGKVSLLRLPHVQETKMLFSF